MFSLYRIVFKWAYFYKGRGREGRGRGKMGNRREGR